MALEELLRELMLLRAPSGYEKEMAYRMRGLFTASGGETRIDRAGNVIAKFAGTSADGPVVMVYAHMDQLGFIVRHIEPDGFLRIDRLGGVPVKVLPSLKLSVRTTSGAWLPGVIGAKSHHASTAEEKTKVDPIESLYVDIGARSAAEARGLGIEIGCPCVYEPSFEKLHGETVCGTSADNRGGCACLAQIAEDISTNRPAATVYLVACVWEEFNLRGAMLAAREIKPDAAVCLDVVLSGDTPDLEGRFDTAVGGGPAVSMYNFHGRGTLNGCIAHEGLARLADEVAAEDSVALQFFASTGIITDSAYLQFENGGTACVDLGFPVRYTHTPGEVCCLRDIADLGRLACGMLRRIGPGFNFNRY